MGRRILEAFHHKLALMGAAVWLYFAKVTFGPVRGAFDLERFDLEWPWWLAATALSLAFAFYDPYPKRHGEAPRR